MVLRAERDQESQVVSVLRAEAAVSRHTSAELQSRECEKFEAGTKGLLLRFEAEEVNLRAALDRQAERNSIELHEERIRANNLACQDAELGQQRDSAFNNLHASEREFRVCEDRT